MLSYYVMHDVVNNLEEKFKEQFTSFDRIFFAANFVKSLDYYNIKSFKGNPYDLRSKIQNSNQKELFTLLCSIIKENKFDQNLILMAYGILINNVINDVCKPYFSSLCGVGSELSTYKNKLKLERIISYHLRDLFPNKNKDYQKVDSTYKATELELNTLTELFAKVYHLSNTKKIIERSQQNLKFYYNQNINFLCFKRWYYSFYDKYSKTNICLRGSLKTKLYKNDVDYLNIENKDWLNPYTNKTEHSSFLDIYQQILVECNKKIEKLNYWIFYNDKSNSMIKRKQFLVENPELINPIFSRNTVFKKNKT